MKENISVEEKVKNIPQKVFLQIGEEVSPDDDFNDLDLESITYHTERVFNNDIEYILKVEPIKEESQTEIWDWIETKNHVLVNQPSGRQLFNILKASFTIKRK